jgi:hypothetical protein
MSPCRQTHDCWFERSTRSIVSSDPTASLGWNPDAPTELAAAGDSSVVTEGTLSTKNAASALPPNVETNEETLAEESKSPRSGEQGLGREARMADVSDRRVAE